jgi:hypothetical protein
MKPGTIAMIFPNVYGKAEADCAIYVTIRGDVIVMQE